MNIAYKGTFLREGLQANGHTLYPLSTRPGENLGAQLRALPGKIGLVVWEFFGGFSGIKALSDCDLPVAAYCIDTPLNEFWLKSCLKNLDYVFVDQPQSVASLENCGVSASWLPLPARSSWFQPQREKKYDITFIGSTDGLRLKRNNLLKLIQSRFKVDIMSGLDIPAAQKVFSQSRITINENFFPGLTMRVLQGLSAGTIVFTEQSPYGDSFGLEDGRDAVFYNPDNVLDRLAELTENYGRFADIARQGQEKSREIFSCERVAADFLSGITAGGLHRKDLDEDERTWNQTKAEVLFAQRFGGDFSAAAQRLRAIAASQSENAWEANLLLGDLRARFKDAQAARGCYESSLAMQPASIVGLKLALLSIQDNELDSALQFISAWLRHSSGRFQDVFSNAIAESSDLKQGLLSAISGIYFSLGRQWDMGFQKNFPDPVPDTALEAARMAWDLAPSSWALDMMSRCLRPYHLQGEMLPFLLEGIRSGLLSHRQLLEAAKTAFDYYDRETAAAIVSGMKKRLR